MLKLSSLLKISFVSLLALSSVPAAHAGELLFSCDDRASNQPWGPFAVYQEGGQLQIVLDHAVALTYGAPGPVLTANIPTNTYQASSKKGGHNIFYTVWDVTSHFKGELNPAKEKMRLEISYPEAQPSDIHFTSLIHLHKVQRDNEENTTAIDLWVLECRTPEM